MRHLVKTLALNPGQAISVISGVGKNATGTGKDVVDIKKGHLEIKALEEKFSPIQLATFADVKEFDPKFHRLQQAIKKTLLPLLVITLLLGWQVVAVQNQVRSLQLFIFFLLGLLVCTCIRLLCRLVKLVARCTEMDWLGRPSH
jgi:hypothetical protein